MGVSLYEQIKEEANELGEEVNFNDGDDDAKDSNGNDEERQQQSVRRQSRQKRGEQSEQGAVPELRGETDGRGVVTGEDAPRSKGGASSEDGGAPRRSRGSSREGSEGASQDAQTPSEDGEEVLEKPLTNADWARQRRENRELKAKLAQLEAEQLKPVVVDTSSPAAIEAKPADKPLIDPKAAEPDRNVNYQEWLEWKLQQQDNSLKEQAKLVKDYQDWRAEQQTNSKNQQLINDAIQEFGGIEESYKKQNPDYMNAVEFGRNKYAEAMKITNPAMTQKQIDSKIDMDILKFASDCATKGLNPAEEIYDMMIERFGYTKSEARQVADDVELPTRKEQRPNLSAVANNRRRSASPLSGGGQGGRIAITKESAADLTNGEFLNLTPDELAMLESQ